MIALAWLIGIAAAAPSLDEPARTGASAPKDAAVVVGIEDYAFIPDVPYARRDADAMADFLLYTRGVPAARIHRPAGGSREQILAAVQQAAGEVGGDGTLWVYFAGHGAASASTGERILLADDVKSDPSLFESRAVKVSELEQAAGSAKALLLLDTCYSGRGRSGADLVAGTRYAVPNYAVQVAKNTAEWAAAGPNEVSGPLDSVAHGAFTYLAIGAMRGWADGELDGKRDGTVTDAEAQAFVTRALRKVATTQQTPSFTAQGSWSLSTGVKEVAPSLDDLLNSGTVAATVQIVARTQRPPSDELTAVLDALKAGKRPANLPARPITMPPTRTETAANGLQITYVDDVPLPLVVVVVALRTAVDQEPAGREGVGRAPYQIRGRNPALLARLEALGGSLDVVASPAGMTLRLVALERNLDASLALLDEVVRPAAVTDAEVSAWASWFAGDLDARSASGMVPATTAAARILTGWRAPGATSVARITKADVAKMLERSSGPLNTALFVSGGTAPDQVVRAISKRWEGWTTNAVALGPAANTAPPKPGAFVVDRALASERVVIMPAVALPRRQDMDYSDFVAASRAMGDARGGGRLPQVLREEKAIAYGAPCLVSPVGGAALWHCPVTVRHQDLGTAIEELRVAFSDVRRARVLSEDEVWSARDKTIAEFANDSARSGYLAGELATSWLSGTPGGWQAEYLDGLRQVSAMSANRALRQNVDFDAMTWVFAGSWDKLAPILRDHGLDPVRLDP